MTDAGTDSKPLKEEPSAQARLLALRGKQANMGFAVIAPFGQDIGFRLGGAEVYAVRNDADFNETAEKLVSGGEYGMIAMPEDMRGSMTGRTARLIEQSLLPVIAWYRYPSAWRPESRAEEDFHELVERAIGYRIRIKV